MQLLCVPGGRGEKLCHNEAKSPCAGKLDLGRGAFHASSACCFEGRGSLQRLSLSHPSVFVFSVASFLPNPYFCGYLGGKSR